MPQHKLSTISFKAEASLEQLLRQIPNRSAFIRSAILSALDNICPLCHGAGILTPEQKKHWEEFALDHKLEECHECNEWHLVCTHSEAHGTHESANPQKKEQ